MGGAGLARGGGGVWQVGVLEKGEGKGNQDEVISLEQLN